ncbi:MAG: glycosyltransferase family 4 protein, partial [Pseudomonadota bacterium]
PFVWGPGNGGVPWPREFRNVQHAEGEWLSYVREAHKLLPGHRRTRQAAAALIAGSCSAWEQFAGYHERCVYVPENAVDPARFTERAQPFRAEPLRVAFVGRLVPYKAADILIEAAAPLVRQGRVVVDVIGDGPEMNRLKALRAQAGVEKGVLLDGWVPHEQLGRRLASAHVFGFPSLREFGGAVVLEAMATGLVPIVVAYGGPNELVSDATGIRVPLGSRESIVAGVRAALERLLSSPELLASFAERARARVFHHFTWEAKAAQVLEVYQWVLGNRSKPDFGMPLPDPEQTEQQTSTPGSGAFRTGGEAWPSAGSAERSH